MSSYIEAEARRRGVSLNTITGTGVGGRITLADVRKAARPLRPLAAATYTPPVSARILNRRSMFDWHNFVDIDDYAANPLADELKQVQPKRFDAAVQISKPPTLFVSGDLPIWTAAGLSVTLLASVPWPARHRIARLDATPAAQLLNDFTPGPASDPVKIAADAFELFRNDEENRDYLMRLENWMQNNTVFGVNGWQPKPPSSI